MNESCWHSGCCIYFNKTKLISCRFEVGFKELLTSDVTQKMYNFHYLLQNIWFQTYCTNFVETLIRNALKNVQVIQA